MTDKRNATSSWSGYNHQGKVGIFLALKELLTLLQHNKSYTDYKIEFEKNGSEDIDISNATSIVSRHQVKAKREGKFPNDYQNVRKINSDSYPSGYQILGTTNENRFLHVICDVLGWDLDEKEFKNEYPRAIYVKNESNVQLYTYPNGQRYCSLTDERNSPIDNFCKDIIKEILKEQDNCLVCDEDHIEETLFEIKNLVTERISEAHNEGKSAYPIISFEEIHRIVTSEERRRRQEIRRSKAYLEMLWQSNYKDSDNTGSDADGAVIFSKILNLPDSAFRQLLIDLKPDQPIEYLKANNNLDNLVNKDDFDYILYNFIEKCNENQFDLSKLRYNTASTSFRLSMISAPPLRVKHTINCMINNQELLKASFDTRYLINMHINDVKFFDTTRDGAYDSNSQRHSNSIFSNDLEFINIESTLKRIEEDRN